jgi:hypothetical protein
MIGRGEKGTRFHMKKRALLLVVAAWGLTACQALGRTPPTATPVAPAATATQPAAAPATDTALPTAMPQPVTDTPAPTNTSEPTATEAASATPSAIAATATATVPPTPDPNEGVGDVVYQDPLDGSGGWFWTFADEVASFGVDTGRGQLKATMMQANAGWRFTISPDTLRIGDQQVRVTAHTEACADNDEYGLMFRVRPIEGTEFEYDGYLFRLRCSGAARFDRVAGTTTSPLVEWTPSSAIHAGAPADNTLLVWAAGGEFRFYANDQYLFSAQDTGLTDGFYGLYVYDRTAGGMTVYFEDLVARGVVR